MAPTIREIAEIAGIDRGNAHTLRWRGFLTTELEPTRPGLPQEVTRANALELCFFVPISNAGVSQVAASREARKWVEEESTGVLERWWVHNPAMEPLSPLDRIGVASNEISEKKLEEISINHLTEAAGGWVGDPSSHSRLKRPHALVLVDRAVIVSDVDNLFRTSNEVNPRIAEGSEDD